MRSWSAILLSAVLVGVPVSYVGAQTADSPATSPAPESLTGFWLTTDYPALTERIGDTIDIELILQNRSLPPRRAELAVTGLPENWTYEIDGGGNPVTAAYVQPDTDQRLNLKLTPAEGAEPGTYSFAVTAQTEGDALTLPITLTLSEQEAAALKLEPKLPALRGSPNSNFDFQIKITNDGPDDQTLNLLAATPAGFQATFKEQYGTQELTSLPLKARESKDVTLSVKLPRDIPAGQYEVTAQIGGQALNASTPLLLDVTGQPDLALEGPEGRLSGDATAGAERTFKFTLENEGTAPARDLKFGATPPGGWKVSFKPEGLQSLDAGAKQEVSVAITPSEQAIAGDYLVTVRANGDGASADASFRVTVLTSTVWGLVGLGVIGAALLVFAVSVARYGRR